jgi:hypothetical protein
MPDVSPAGVTYPEGVPTPSRNGQQKEPERDPHDAMTHACFSSPLSRMRTEDVHPRQAMDYGFKRGAQWMARTSGSLSPHFAQLAELMAWLMERPEDDPWLTPVEEWHTDPVPETNGSGDSEDPW